MVQNVDVILSPGCNGNASFRLEEFSCHKQIERNFKDEIIEMLHLET
jgi:hypothetical protein